MKSRPAYPALLGAGLPAAGLGADLSCHHGPILPASARRGQYLNVVNGMSFLAVSVAQEARKQ